MRSVLKGTIPLIALVIATKILAATIPATSQNILSVFKSANDGDTIVLSGSFGVTQLQNRSFTTGLTIDATAATFTDTLKLANISNLTILGGHFGSPTVPTSYNRAIYIAGGSNIAISGASVTGAFIGTGIGFSGTVNASVTGSTFTQLKSGISMDSVTYGLISQNQSIASVSDGFDVSNSHNVTVSNNSCTGTTPTTGAHPDCVQLWTSPGMTPQSDIVISGNTANGSTQGFDAFDSSGMGAVRVSLINNTISGYFPQGVACYDCIDSIITGNVLNPLVGSQWKVSVNVIGGSNNTVANNYSGPVDKTQAVPLVYYDRVMQGSVPVLVVSNGTGPPAVVAVPEPDTWAMLLAGFAITGVKVRRRRVLVAAGGSDV